MTSRGRFGSALLVVATLAGACGEDARDERPALSTCGPPPRELAGDPAVLRVLDGLPQRRIVDGVWLNGYDNTRLTIELEVAAPMSDDDRCGQPLLVPVTARVRSSDGFIDARPDQLRITASEILLEVATPGVPAPYLQFQDGPEAFRRTARPAASSGPTLRIRFAEGLPFGEPAVSADLAVEGTLVVGLWSSERSLIPRGPHKPYLVPPALEAECAPAAAFTSASAQYTAFSSAAEAAAAPVGNWIRCRDAGGSPHAGLQVSADGTWRHAIWESDRFVIQRGLTHEGIVRPPIDTSENNGRPGFYQVDLAGDLATRATRIWGDRMIVSDLASNAPPEAVYVRTSRPFAERPVPFQPRERAGAAACAHPEEGIVEMASSTELTPILAGRWTLCSGNLLDELAGIHFEGADSVTLTYAGPTPPRTTTYRVSTNPGPFPGIRSATLILADDTTWEVILSERPLKIFLTTPPSEAHPDRAYFTAVP